MKIQDKFAAVTRLTEILPKYRNTPEKYRNTSERHLLKKPILALIKKRIYLEDDVEKLRGQRSSCGQRRLIRRLIWVFTGRTGLIVLKVSKFSWSFSIKLVSFPCSLCRLIWVYTVCIGLSVPVFRFFKLLILLSFMCISDEERLYKVSLFFSRSGFLPRFHLTLLLRAHGFFMRDKGNVALWLLHFLGILIIIMFSIYR